MPINATNNGGQRELIPAGNYVARCYQMIHIGTVPDTYMGRPKSSNKVRIGWELPTEMRVFDPAKGEQPISISKTFTLSMGEKSNLRKMLASWRGKDFSEDEAKCFDVLKLIGVPCMINIIHKPNQDGTKIYEDIAGVTPLPKGLTCPPQINANQIWDYDQPNYDLFNSLPDFLKTDIQSSEEYKKLHSPGSLNMDTPHEFLEPLDDLPF